MSPTHPLTCPLCGETQGFDCEVYVTVMPTKTPTAEWVSGSAGVGIRCVSCGDDITEAGEVEPDSELLARILKTLNGSTAGEALEDALTATWVREIEAARP